MFPAGGAPIAVVAQNPTDSGWPCTYLYLYAWQGTVREKGDDREGGKGHREGREVQNLSSFHVSTTVPAPSMNILIKSFHHK